MSLTDSIHVGCDFTDLPSLLKPYPQVFCVYDKNTKQYVEQVRKICPDIRSYYAIQATEEHKTIDTVLGICQWLLESGANRDVFLLTIGGGLTSDMGGFAASIYKRGIRFAYIPTTLLSQVDAAIGGKTGINLESYKNILGTIVQPVFTYINVSVLDSLPRCQFLSGYAELLKTFIIGNSQMYQCAIEFLSSNNNNQSVLIELIQNAAIIKAGVVERDEFEKGERRHLNLGHTIAHAIEWYQRTHSTEKEYSHGEAVSIGICQAAKISEKLGFCELGVANQIITDFKKCSLPTELPWSINELEDAFFKDKKAVSSGVYFVLIERIGKVTSRLITREEWFTLKAI